MAIFVWVQMLANFGFETHGTRTIAQDISNNFINGIIILRSIYVFVLLLLILIINVYILPKFNYLLMYQAVSLLLLPFNVQYIFRGLNKTKYDGIFRTAQAGLFFVLVYSFISAGRLLLIPILWIITVMLTIMPSYIFIKRKLSYSFMFPSVNQLKNIMHHSIPVGIASVLILVYMNFDTILLGIYVDNCSIGMYTAAFKIYYFGYSLLALHYIAFLPSLSKNKNIQFKGVLQSYILTLFIFSFFVAITGPLNAKYIILSFFGEQYASSVNIMKILFISLSLGCINFAFMNPFQAVGKDKIFIALLLARTILFITLCFILIPLYGIMGAAFSTLFSEVMSCIIGIILHINTFRSEQWVT